jgi:uncharacterized protein YbjT (DUF2867 family)
MTMTTPMIETAAAPVLVLGANGKTGRRVRQRLEAAGVPVRAGSRSGTPRFDWDDAETWGPALAGARSAYVTFQPDVAMPGALATVTAFFAAARDHGVKRLVLLSGRGEEEAVAAEEALKASGADWTVLSAAWFFQNFSEDFYLDPIRAGHVALPVAAAAPEPFIDAEDIADVAFKALTEPGHSGRKYELTGPRAMTFAEAFAEIAAATGRPLRLETVTPEAYAAALRADGLPPALVDLIVYLFTSLLDGRNSRPTDDVRQVLGREPRDFAGYVERTAASGVWTPAASPVRAAG